MSEPIPNDGPVSLDDVLDSLVEGTLDEARRAKALEQVEVEPDGWRRVALAFLEHQCWSQALMSLGPGQSDPVARHQLSDRRFASHTARPILMLTAAAAALLASFGMGWGIGTRGNPLVTREQVAKRIGSDTPTWRSNSQVSDVHSTYVDEFDMMEQFYRSNWPDPNRFALAESSTGSASERNSSAIVPGYVRGLLEREGYSVEPLQGFVPVLLEDGRRVQLPVETMHVRYTGFTAY